MPATDVDIPETAEDFMPQRRAAGVFAHFYKRTVRDEAQSKEQGRPVHKGVEFVKLKVPGDKTLEIDRPVRDEDKRAYRDQYRAFLEERSQDEAAGQLLKTWPGIPEELAEDFLAQGVRTVEMLAAVSDGNLAGLGPLARRYRDKAADYLKTSKEAAPILKMQDELEKRDKQIAALQAQIEQLATSQTKQKTK